MEKLRFLRPKVVGPDSYRHFLDDMDDRHWYVNFGPIVREFEARLIAERFAGRGRAVSVNNATTGLMLAITHFRRPGRFALMPSFTFAATPLSAQWCGLEPYFVDVDPETWCMDEAQVTRLIQELGEEIAVVLPYAAFGSAMDLSLYQRLHGEGIPMVVDAAASFGSTVDGFQFGQDFPGAVVFSFHATKAFAVGEAGMVYTTDAERAVKIRQSTNFGFSEIRETVLPGLNGKMSEFEAARGLATLDVYDVKVAIRRQLEESYLSCLADTGLFAAGWRVQKERGQVPRQYMSVLGPRGTNNRAVAEAMDRGGVEVRTYYGPSCHHMPLFRNCPHADLAVTEQLSQRMVSLPFWEDMTVRQVAQVVELLAEVAQVGQNASAGSARQS